MMKLPKIVGITGTNGAGKDTLGELLAERKKYKFVSLSDILREELTRQGVPHEREHMRALSARWHNEFGAGHLSRRTIEHYVEEEEREGYQGLVIGSIRRSTEVEVLKSEGAIVIWVDADRRKRYERLQGGTRGRVTDHKTFEEWCAEEDAEMHPPEGDTAALDMANVRELVDLKIDNNFDSFEAYRDYLIKEFEL